MTDADPPQDVASTPAATDDPRRQQLADLSAQATGAYGRKDYNKAAELYAEAVELQAELNGEMLPENAELLYAYGRCLYKVGVSQSDVLGNKVAGDGTTSKKRKREAAPTKATDATGDISAAKGEAKDDSSKNPKAEGQPYFELQGDDADWDDSDEDGEDADAADAEGGDGEEDDDDFAIAYEILDVARVLYNKQIDALRDEGKGKSKDTEMSPGLRQCLEKLADIRDLQAEISLENEKFPEAVEETRASLAILESLYPLHNRLVAEAHFKLSLALEFASITTVKAADGQKQEEAQVDEAMRAEAAEHTAKTIESCKLRKQLEEEALPKLTGDEASEKKKQLKDISEMLEEFEQRLQDLRAPTQPMVADPAAIFAGAFQDAGSTAKREQKAAQAQDISGLVKHKKKPAATVAATDAGGTNSSANGKRPAEDTGAGPESKKAKAEA